MIGLPSSIKIIIEQSIRNGAKKNKEKMIVMFLKKITCQPILKKHIVSLR